MKSFTKTVKLLAVAFLLIPGFAQAQEVWQYYRPFPDTSVTTGHRSVQGLAVDENGKVWFQSYYQTETIEFTDTVFVGSSKVKTYSVRALQVYNADGTDASISPVVSLSNGDTLGLRYLGNDEATGYRKYELMTGRGLRASHDGKYVYVSQGNVLYKLDAADASVEAKFVYPTGASIPAVGVAASGEVFVRPIVGGETNPLLLLNPDLTVKETVSASTSSVIRTSWAPESGNAFYYPKTSGGVAGFTREDELSSFEGPTDITTIMGEAAIGYNKTNGLVYVNSGGKDFIPETPVTGINIYTIYGFSLDEPEVLKDSIVIGLNNPNIFDYGDGVRAIEFSPDGKSAYIGFYHYQANMPSVFEFKLGTETSIADENNSIPAGYALKQNYPNPFNPTTNISFELGQSGFTTLKVYDMLGREVSTLVNGEMMSGNHAVTFNASNLSSGTYMYILVSNNVRLVGKMTLIK
ncbi:T9SS type A sorting domain-containing protein [bacterium]|nr:MAG: T9SS type A sorting domain-containing protein [bacterium]